MKEDIFREYTAILKEELKPAMGCTEPIAVAWCACLAAEQLGQKPETVKVTASPNIIKNVKSVIVHNTDGLKGIAAAAAAGIIAADPKAELEVLARLTDEKKQEIRDYLEEASFTTERSENHWVFHVKAEVSADGHTAMAELAGHHTNLIRLEKDGETVFEKPYQEKGDSYTTDRSLLKVEDIVAYAEETSLDEVKELLQRQIDCNMAIVQAGLHHNYGANIGKILLRAYGSTPANRAKAYAAAGSDARMNGCELPVIINSGSGNQGITVSVPVIVYAREMGTDQETLYRALLVANLVAIHLKTGIGSLSAYCGATSAAAGAGAGICWLHGGRYYEIAHTVVNAVAINSGMICDGAKASCAAKIASAVEAGLLGYQMQRNREQFYGGEGIVTKGVENTIANIGRLARDGMAETDRTIIEIMTKTGC